MFILFFLRENTSQFFEKYKLSGKTNKIVLSTRSIQNTKKGFQVVHIVPNQGFQLRAPNLPKGKSARGWFPPGFPG